MDKVNLNKMPDWLIVFVWFVLALSIFYSGHLYSNDTVSKVESARNFIKNGSFAVSGYNGAWGIPVPGGTTYPQFSLGSILMMVPPVVCYEVLSGLSGKELPSFVQSFLVSGCNLIYTAIMGCLIFILLVKFGKTIKESFVYSSIVIFCTSMLQYSQTGWSEPATLLFSLSGFVILSYQYNQTEKLSFRNLYLWAVFSMCASLIRIEYITFYLIFLIVLLFKKKITFKAMFGVLSILSFAVVAHLLFNLYRFESLFNFGYVGKEVGDATSFVSAGTKSFLEILQWFNPWLLLKQFIRLHLAFGRTHWFWVSPLILLAPFTFFKKGIPEPLLWAFTGSTLYIFILLGIGSNSWGWANRYIYIIIPFLLFPIFFYPYKRSKRLKNAFKVLSITGLIISIFSTLINSHYVQEVLVNKYGYHDAMSVKTVHFFNAPFWYHLKLFPGHLFNTLQLMVQGNNIPAWEILRETCLDIWPVGLCGAGLNSYMAFGSWFALVVTTILYKIKLIDQRLNPGMGMDASLSNKKTKAI